MLKKTCFYVFLFLSAGFAGATEYSDVTERIFTVSGIPELILRNPDGVIQIEPSSNSEVSIKITREVRGAKDEAAAKKELERISLDLDQAGNQIRAITRWRSGFRITPGPSIHVRYVVFTPTKSNVRAEVSDGELYVRALDGTMDLNTSDGEIVASELSGDLRITASDGDIDLKRSSGSMRLSVSDGTVRAEQCKGEVYVRSADGRVELPGFEGVAEVSNGDGDVVMDGVITALQGRTADGEMTIKIAPGSVMQSDWKLSAADGEIFLDLPDDFSANLEITTGDGRVETDHPVHVVGRLSSRNVSGKIGAGGHLLQIKTGDGNVAIK